MKEAPKNSLLNYFSKRKPSDLQSNLKENDGEEMIRTEKGNGPIDPKEKRPNQENVIKQTVQMIKEMEPSEGEKSKEKQIKASVNLPQKTLTKRKRKDEMEDTDEEDGNSRARKFKSLSKEVRAAIAIAQLMELSDDGDADDESDGGLKSKKIKASTKEEKQAKKPSVAPAKSTKKPKGTFKSSGESLKVEASTKTSVPENEKPFKGKTTESKKESKKIKDTKNTSEIVELVKSAEEDSNKIQNKTKIEMSPKKIAHSVKVGTLKPRNDISSFFTKLKKKE